MRQPLLCARSQTLKDAQNAMHLWAIHAEALLHNSQQQHLIRTHRIFSDLRLALPSKANTPATLLLHSAIALFIIPFVKTLNHNEWRASFAVSLLCTS